MMKQRPSKENLLPLHRNQHYDTVSLPDWIPAYFSIPNVGWRQAAKETGQNGD